MIDKILMTIRAMRHTPGESYREFKRKLESELDYLRSQKCRQWEADEKEQQQPVRHDAGAYERGSNGAFRRHRA